MRLLAKTGPDPFRNQPIQKRKRCQAAYLLKAGATTSSLVPCA